MNWIILVGLALFFVATGATGWRFGDNGPMNVRVTNDAYSLDIKGAGDIDLAADGSGVTALADGGYLDISMTRDGTRRRVRFTGGNDAIERQFSEDGDVVPWGPEADRFVTEAMPIVLRETGLNVAERVAWLLENRGHGGLLDEIDLIRSDFAQRLYTVRYAESTEIPPADFGRLMTTAEDNMGSDFDLRTTLTEVYDAQTPTGAPLVALLAAGRSIGSDFDARTLLETVGGRMPSAPEAATAYLEVAATIGSDFDLRHALLPFVTQTHFGDDDVARAIDMAGAEIGSDFDLRALLSEAATRVGSSDALARAYTTAAGSIGSDFDHKEALVALADGADLTPAGWRMLLESAQAIGGDFECAAVLMTVAPQLPRDDAVVAAYRTTLATVGSDFEQRRAAAALESASR